MILRTEGLTKVFETRPGKKLTAVADLALSVEPGEIFGFVGPIGAGKTTTIKMLVGLIFPTRGRAFLFDAPIPSARARARLGYLPENPSYHEFLSGAEALRFFATLAGVPRREQGRRCAELLELVGLGDAGDRQIRKYSKGMQQRLGLAQALVGDPEFVVLDEPMSGLDPVGRREVRDLMLELKRRGKTVFFSTHILPDVETVCDRVGVIVGGRLRDVGHLGEMLSAHVKTVEITASLPNGSGPFSAGRILSTDGDRVTALFDDEARGDAAVAAVLASGGRVVAVTPNRETLEDFFLRRLQEGRASAEPSRDAAGELERTG